MPPSFFSPDTMWAGTQILLSEQHGPHNGWFFHYLRINQKDLTHSRNHPSGGVRGGTIRLLPVDSKAEAMCSRLLSS